jgi:hypothetical protein
MSERELLDPTFLPGFSTAENAIPRVSLLELGSRSPHPSVANQANGSHPFGAQPNRRA